MRSTQPNLNEQIGQYSLDLVALEVTHKLPPILFDNPDHMAIKTASVSQFEEYVRSISDISDELYCLEDNDRFIVAAKLAARIAVGFNQAVRWIEIKEPRPELVGQDLVGIDHVEYLVNDIEAAIVQVDVRGVEHQLQSQGNHQIISASLNELGQEVRISNTPLAALVTEKLESDEIYTLKAA